MAENWTEEYVEWVGRQGRLTAASNGYATLPPEVTSLLYTMSAIIREMSDRLKRIEEVVGRG